MPDEELLYDLADLFKVFADTTRIKILFALMARAMSVGELAEAIGATQSAISHQLRQLKQAHLVKFQRDGKSVIYSPIGRPCVHHACTRHDPYLANSRAPARYHSETSTKRKEPSCVRRLNLDELDCANCGAKIEAGIKQIEGVNNAKVTFMTQKLMIDADDARF